LSHGESSTVLYRARACQWLKGGLRPSPRPRSSGLSGLSERGWRRGAMCDYAKDGLVSMQSLIVNLLPVPDQISESRDGPSCPFALRNGDQEMSYGELKCRADQFARIQVQNGAGSGGIVTICISRSKRLPAERRRRAGSRRRYRRVLHRRLRRRAWVSQPA
jgi:hypothetical protein